MQKFAVTPRKLLHFLPFLFLPWILLQFYFSDPSCISSSVKDKLEDPSHDLLLKAMVVADLHLAGPNTMWLDRLRREAFMKSSFKRAHKVLKPHALLILGDVSDWGRKSTEEQWTSVVRRFDDLVRMYSGLPYHVLPGNHDIGDFYQITPTLLKRFVSTIPGLDETASTLFTIRNVTFVSINAMALACADCPMHETMRKVVDGFREALCTQDSASLACMGPRDLQILPHHGDGPQRPVLLTHLPLYRMDESVCDWVDVPKCAPWHELEGACMPILGSAQRVYPLTPYRSMIDMISYNTSHFLLSGLKPRLVLSAHVHRFCSRILHDGTQEVTVPTFTWRNRDDPSFLLVQFYKDGTHHIEQCFLPHESFVLGLHVLQGSILIVCILFWGTHHVLCRKRLVFKSVD